MDAALLDVKDLTIEFVSRDGAVRVAEDVSFSIFPGETLGMVGESGCGKSVTALAVIRLLGGSGIRYAGGSIKFRGRELLELDDREMRRIRGNDISMIFQEPMVSLNPVMRLGEQLAEVIREHESLGRTDIRARCRELFSLVRIADPEQRLDQYPHELSGGMRQRAMIAMALACNPMMLIADEPTTALDVTIQAQILALIEDLQTRLRMAVLFISHDLRVISEVASRVIVMHAGRIVETATTDALFARPSHPYTVGLLGAMPTIDGETRRRLAEIPGMVPSPSERRLGCAFASRCGRATKRCQAERPDLSEIEPGHLVACWYAAHAA